MRRAERRLRALLWGCALALACLPPGLRALGADRDEPITIEADQATLYDRSGTSTYQGNVHLRQGTRNMHGDNMEVQMRDDRIETIVMTGAPATFVQQVDDGGQAQHAEAGRIEYHAASERMILLGDARIWQSDTEEFSSDRIVFNLADRTINAGGSGAGDRVRITLQPDRHAGPAQPEPEPEPGPAPAPDTDADSSGGDGAASPERAAQPPAGAAPTP